MKINRHSRRSPSRRFRNLKQALSQPLAARCKMALNFASRPDPSGSAVWMRRRQLTGQG